MADAAPHDSKQITLTFPDGATRKVEAGTTGLSVAKAISPSLAKRTVAMSLDGNLADLADPITKDAAIKFIARTDPEALELIRHDAAHVMAEAVQALWPKTQVTIGPVIENGFYYDFAKQEPFHPDDLAKIEKKMARDHRQERAVHEGVLEPQAGEGFLPRARRELQGRAGRRHPRRPRAEDLQAGRMARPLPRPAHDLDGRRSAKPSSCRRSPAPIGAVIRTARCCSGSTARPGRPRTSSRTTCTGSRKPRSATTASSAARWTCSISRRRRRARCSGTPRAGRCSRRSSPTCAVASTRPATTRSTLPT